MIAGDAWRQGRVCVIAMSAMGDTVHTLPVLTALKRHAPASRITCVLQPVGAALVEGHRAVDRVVVYQREAPAMRAFRALRQGLAGGFDLVLALNVSLKAGVTAALTSSPVKLGFDRARARDLNWLFTSHRIPPHPPQHVQDQYFEFLNAIGVPPEPVSWGLDLDPREREAQRAFFGGIDRPVAALVIGSSDPRKNWMPERWAELADALTADHGLQPVLVGGRSVGELRAEQIIMQRARHAPLSRLGRPLRELVWLLDGAGLVVSGDTGPLHVAVALDRPVIGLYGHTNPRRTGPWRRFHDLLVDAYHDPGEAPDAAPGYRNGRMERIGMSEVLAKVTRWRERYSNLGGTQ